MHAPITETIKFARPVVWKPISPNRKLPTNDPTIPTIMDITKLRSESIILPAMQPTIAPAMILQSILTLLLPFIIFINDILKNDDSQC